MRMLRFLFADPTGIVADQFRTSYMPVLDAIDDDAVKTYAATAMATGLFEKVDVIDSSHNLPFMLRKDADENFGKLWRAWTGQRD
jgi:hypothetical protein